MLIRPTGLLPKGGFFLPEFSPQLAVHKPHPGLGRRLPVLKEPSHLPEQPQHPAGHSRSLPALHPIQQEPGILTALFRRQCKPVDGGLLVFGNQLSRQVQPAQSVLGILVPLGRRDCEKPDCLGDLFRALGVGEQLLA